MLSSLEAQFEIHIRSYNLPNYEFQYRFCANHVGLYKGIRKRLKDAGLRDWRFDFAWPEFMLAVEIEGGGWINGRHNRGKGFEEDLQKYHNAMMMGWVVYRCDGRLIKELNAIKFVKKYLEERQ